MQCLGLTPAAYASGERRQPGSITKAGHPHARRALIAGAWASRDPAQVRRHLPRRLEHQPQRIQDLSWQAHVRLGTRSRRLVAQGKHAHGVTGAMARALAGFRWAMAQEVLVTASVQQTKRPCPLNAAGVPPCIGRDAAPGWCHPRRRAEARKGHSRLERGRHPTEASQVVPNPRRAAGSPVVADWLRLF